VLVLRNALTEVLIMQLDDPIARKRWYSLPERRWLGRRLPWAFCGEFLGWYEYVGRSRSVGIRLHPDSKELSSAKPRKCL